MSRKYAQNGLEGLFNLFDTKKPAPPALEKLG